jgi:hypothetical protein
MSITLLVNYNAKTSLPKHGSDRDNQQLLRNHHSCIGIDRIRIKC